MNTSTNIDDLYREFERAYADVLADAENIDFRTRLATARENLMSHPQWNQEKHEQVLERAKNAAGRTY